MPYGCKICSIKIFINIILPQEEEGGEEEEKQLYPHFNLENTKILDKHVEAYFSFTTNEWAKDEFNLSNMIDYRLKYYEEGSAFVYDKKDTVSSI